MLKDKPSLPEIEKKVLDFWDKNHIFEKTIEHRKKNKAFSFYDGPPFATGLPHYGHILATTIKDSVTRFWTMKGYKVERRVGWDCHGLPVENLIEKELGLKDKSQVEEMGIEKFNDACRAAVFRSVGDFQKTLKRVGRWADYSNSYATFDNDYIESVWWVFKALWDEGLIYSDYRVTPYCPRCGTPLSNFEVNQGYKDVDDPAIFVKFKLKEQEDNIPTYFVAWTTTPWTLTANAALAVNKDIDYVKVRVFDRYDNGKAVYQNLILAKLVYEKIINNNNHHSLYSVFEGFKTGGGEISIMSEKIKDYKGSELVGKEYEPIFSFIKPEKKAHFVIDADFVSVEDGSGIVHIAPAFGADDMEAARENNIPVILTVNGDGKFVEEVKPWAGRFVKKADADIIEYLKAEGSLLGEEKIKHSYPFCWRCDTPLLYYPIDSWYVEVTKIKDRLIKNNKEIRWVPAHLKEGRFGKWLEDARDWAVSRNRFWGAPMPVWKCSDCGKHIPIGSLDDLAKLSTAKNQYYFLRHGEADSNVLNIVSSFPEKFEIGLTEKGKKEIEKAVKELKKEGIDMIISSPLNRTKQTAEVVSKALGIKYKIDERLAEYDFGRLNGATVEEFEKEVGNHAGKFKNSPEGGETLVDVRSRVFSLVKELEENNKGKNILFISHGDPLWVLQAMMEGKGREQVLKDRENLIQTGEWRKVTLKNSPLNSDGDLDMHRPYIDSVKIKCPDCGGEASRISQVFDCWFESGSMPYASWHYPFDNKKRVENIFPADFIAEGLDQTRGWFYTLHVLAAALTKKNIGLGKNNPAFKNVIVNGLILDESGRKLSKKLRNYTEPEILFDTIGADAVRYFLLSSTSIGEDYRFSDKGVAETKTKVISRLLNSYNFFEMYADDGDKLAGYKDKAKENVIDKWIKARLKQVIFAVESNMEKYELTQATRPIADFLDDLSNWYIRRSRTRLQRPDSRDDFYAASKTLYECLIEISKVMAPFTPFIAEAVYRSLTEERAKESVHLEDWPKASKLNKEEESLILDMILAREAASQALARRSDAGIKVKQPLNSYKFSIEAIKDKTDIIKLIAEEANVKQVIYDKDVSGEGVLDVEIGHELRREGMLREIIRMIQGLRQNAGLEPGEKALLYAYSEEEEIKSIIFDNKDKLIADFSLLKINFKKDDNIEALAEKDINNRGKIWLGIKLGTD
jgi:isoleucyl-tRNA synthetase